VFDFVTRQRWSVAIDPREAPERAARAIAITADGQRVAVATSRGERFAYSIE
jgi:hypothetical protein